MCASCTWHRARAAARGASIDDTAARGPEGRASIARGAGGGGWACVQALYRVRRCEEAASAVHRFSSWRCCYSCRRDGQLLRHTDAGAARVQPGRAYHGWDGTYARAQPHDVGVGLRAQKYATTIEALKLTDADAQQLFDFFHQVDEDGSGEVSLLEFFDFLDLKRTKFAKRAFGLFDEDGSGEIVRRHGHACLPVFAGWH